MPEPAVVSRAPEVLGADYLDALLTEFADESVHAVALIGSYARGEADAFSDVDLVCFVHQLPERKRDRHWIGYRGGRLVAITVERVEGELACFREPACAIFSVPAFRAARVMLDREGKLDAVRQTALAFTWAPLQPAADEYASGLMADLAEVAHKVLGGLAAGDPDRIANASGFLMRELTRAAAVQRGVLITSDRHYFRLVREAVGQTTAWTRLHRLAAGVATEAEAAAGRPPWEVRGVATLRLYCETAKLLRPILVGGHREVVDGALQVVATSGWCEAKAYAPTCRARAP